MVTAQLTQQWHSSKRMEQERRSRLEKRLSSARRQSGEPAGELLACPQCKSRYPFGDSCPTCDVFLVCASMADLVKPQPVNPPIQWGRVVFDVFVLTVITAAVSLAWFYYLYGGWWSPGY